MYKKLSASEPPPPPGALPLDPARPPFRLAIRALAMVPLGKSWIRHCSVSRYYTGDCDCCHQICRWHLPHYTISKCWFLQILRTGPVPTIWNLIDLCLLVSHELLERLGGSGPTCTVGPEKVDPPATGCSGVAGRGVQGSGPTPELPSGIHAKRKNPVKIFS